MTPTHTTEYDPESYLASLAIDPGDDPDHGIEEVSAADGAVLYKVGSQEHFVLMVCTDHVHKGAPMLKNVLPRNWEEFYRAANPDEGFIAHHYGPVLPPC